ncbi:MAG: hypothetical protein ABFD70_09485 [Syntrophaceae bacterium]|nr:hypothetical protein [Deltaproteobacteria bacterium]
MKNPFRPCAAPLFPRAFLIVALVLLCAPFATAYVDLGGYRFSDDPIEGVPGTQDSSDLSGNYYFSNFEGMVDFHFSLLGYGEFKGYEILQQYRFVFPAGGVQCAVVEEQGYIPFFSPDDGVTSFDIEQCTTYYYYARDIEDNIHLLQVTIDPYNPDIEPMAWSYEDLPAGGTTLIYPDSPYVGQQVFGGEVIETSAHLGDVSHEALVIDFDSRPYAFPGPVKQYLLPGSGILAGSYNWDGGTNGFSRDARAPENEEDSKGAWEEWKDNHCFISACSGY